MTTGVIKTKGTRIYFAVSESEIHKVACPTGVSGLGGPASQIPIGCLDSEEEEYEQGVRDPSQIPIPINLIPRSASHQAIVDLESSGETVPWMIVLSNQAGDPVALDSDGLHLVSPGPTTVKFRAYVADFEITAERNEVVRATLTLQRSGAKFWDWPTPDLA